MAEKPPARPGKIGPFPSSVALTSRAGIRKMSLQVRRTHTNAGAANRQPLSLLPRGVLAMPKPARRHVSRARPPGGEGGVQPPLLNTVVKRDTAPPPFPPAPAPASTDDLLEALRNEGVRISRAIVRDFDPDRIWAAIEAYQEAEDVGPGLLVWMIREGCEPRRKAEADPWLERRMEIHALRQERAS